MRTLKASRTAGEKSRSVTQQKAIVPRLVSPLEGGAVVGISWSKFGSSSELPVTGASTMTSCALVVSALIRAATPGSAKIRLAKEDFSINPGVPSHGGRCAFRLAWGDAPRIGARSISGWLLQWTQASQTCLGRALSPLIQPFRIGIVVPNCGAALSTPHMITCCLSASSVILVPHEDYAPALRPFEEDTFACPDVPHEPDPPKYSRRAVRASLVE